VQLPEGFPNDAGSLGIAPGLHKRQQIIPLSIFEQVGALVMGQQADGPTPTPVSQRGRATTLIDHAHVGQQLEDRLLALMMDDVNLAGGCAD
jgi:hypothetical protein